MFGFTGTPIFADNASRAKQATTKDLFGDMPAPICDHRRNSRIRMCCDSRSNIGASSKRKDGSLIDEKVRGDQHQGVFRKPRPDRRRGRLDHRQPRPQDPQQAVHRDDVRQPRRCADPLLRSVQGASATAGEHDLRVATIFTYATNEEDTDADGLIGEPDLNVADTAGQRAQARKAGKLHRGLQRDVSDHGYGQRQRRASTPITRTSNQRIKDARHARMRRIRTGWTSCWWSTCS